MIAEWVAAVWAPPVSHHAEGPLWDDAGGRLLWTDQYLGLVRTATSGTDHAVLHDVGSAVGAVVPHADGGWVLAAGHGFMRLYADGTVDPIADVLPDDGIRRRMNDGKVDPLGRFWAGSMAYDKTPGAGSLYVLDRGRVREVRTGLTISNGLGWTADGQTMFHIDTPTRRIDRFRVGADGAIGDQCVAVRIVGDEGAPDGMCVDAEGALWVALWGAGVVHRYSPEGELLGIVRVDAPQVSSCAFGGPDAATLFITTSREDYAEADVAAHPRAGAVFAVRPGVAGVRAATYVG